MDPLTVQPSPIITRQPEINFQTQGVPPPTPLYLEQDDDIFFRVAAPTITLGFQVNFAIRTLMPGGKIKVHNTTLLINATTITLRRNYGECFLLSVTASLVGAATAARGQVFSQASIVRGVAGGELFYWTLLSDYVTTLFRPTWPNAILKSPLEGPGFLRTLINQDPGAGSDILLVVPAQTRQRLHSIRLLLTTSATVVNRTVSIQLDNGANGYYQATSLSPQAASLTWVYTFSPNSLLATVQALNVVVGLPINITLLAGHRVQTATTNLQAGDQFFAVNYLMEEWVDI